MSNKEKASELSKIGFDDLSNPYIKAIIMVIKDRCFGMAQWKDEQLDSAIDKALQRNGDFLKQGKITQYGYDIAFVTIQNIREYLKQ